MDINVIMEHPDIRNGVLQHPDPEVHNFSTALLPDANAQDLLVPLGNLFPADERVEYESPNVQDLFDGEKGDNLVLQAYGSSIFKDTVYKYVKIDKDGNVISGGGNGKVHEDVQVLGVEYLADQNKPVYVNEKFHAVYSIARGFYYGTFKRLSIAMNLMRDVITGPGGIVPFRHLQHSEIIHNPTNEEVETWMSALGDALQSNLDQLVPWMQGAFDLLACNVACWSATGHHISTDQKWYEKFYALTIFKALQDDEATKISNFADVLLHDTFHYISLEYIGTFGHNLSTYEDIARKISPIMRIRLDVLPAGTTAFSLLAGMLDKFHIATGHVVGEIPALINWVQQMIIRIKRQSNAWNVNVRHNSLPIQEKYVVFAKRLVAFFHAALKEVTPMESDGTLFQAKSLDSIVALYPGSHAYGTLTGRNLKTYLNKNAPTLIDEMLKNLSTGTNLEHGVPIFNVMTKCNAIKVMTDEQFDDEFARGVWVGDENLRYNPAILSTYKLHKDLFMADGECDAEWANNQIKTHGFAEFFFNHYSHDLKKVVFAERQPRNRGGLDLSKYKDVVIPEEKQSTQPTLDRLMEYRMGGQIENQ